jgi:hypothetical protein
VKPKVPTPATIISAVISGSMLLQFVPQLVTIELSPNICKSKATLLNDEPDDEPDAKPVMSYSTIEALAAPDLRNFLIDAKRIGVACTKYRDGKGNGWTFPPLAEAREAWAQLYGPQCWDNADAKDWGDQN